MRARPPPARGEDGVSNVLGAVLMFGLLVLTLVTIQVKFVPVWDEDREARHMQALSGDLRQAKGDLDRQAGNDTAGVVTGSIELEREGGLRFFQAADGIGSVATFAPAPAGVGIQVTTGNPVRVLERGGRALFGLDDAGWQDYVTEDRTDIGAVSYFVLRIHMGAGSNCGDAEGDEATLAVRDAAGALVGQVAAQVVDSGNGSDCHIRVRTFDGDLVELNEDIEVVFHQVGSPYNLYYDLLEPQRLIGALLAQAAKPLTLSFVQGAQPLDADYQIAYEEAGSGDLAGSAGLAEASYDSGVIASGKLTVRANNQRFVPQDYVLEHGALVLAQQDGEVMAAPPALAIGHSPARTSLTWTVPALLGEGGAQSTARVGLAAAGGDTQEDVLLLASEISLRIPTENHAAWRTYFEGAFAAAGLLPAGYAISPDNGARIEVDLEGPVDDDTTLDVALRLRIRSTTVALSPG